MEIKLKCSCGQVLKVGEEAAGKTGKCPACNNPIRIPSIEEIEAAREKQAAQAVPEVELELEEEEEEAPSKFRAPTRTKSRSKMLADVRSEKEDRRKSETRTRRAEKGKGKGKTRTGTRGKSRTKTKTRGGRRSTSVMDKYRRKSGRGDEDSEYVHEKKSPLKMLIIIGVVVIGGLIAAYALHWGPIANSKAVHKEYVDNMRNFVIRVRSKMVEKYERMFPGTTSQYDGRLEDLKDDGRRVHDVLRKHKKLARAMKSGSASNPTSLYLMDQIVQEILPAARKFIIEKMEAESAAKLTDELNNRLKQQFSDKITEVNETAAKIEALIKTINDKIN